MFGLLTLPEEAHWASEAIGDDCVSRFCRDIVHDADDYESSPDDGESLSLVPLEDADRIALTILAAIDVARARSTYESGNYVPQYGDDPITYEDGGYANSAYVVVFVSSQGFAYADFFDTEEEARADYEARAQSFRQYDEDEEESADVPSCAMCGGEHITPSQWSDACERHAPLLGELRRAESFGGTE